MATYSFAITPPGMGELLIILVVVLLLFGAKKLPELGGAVGRSIKNFKSGIEDGAATDEDTEDSGSTTATRDS